VTPPGVQTSSSATTLKAMCHPCHGSRARVHEGGAIWLR